ncbi:MAG: sulfatase-like hydrolase/transferase [Chloroflexi bacterium]|nr:sulfatase-like hydrolase/transferase [Chloroflexota bacterium]
MTAQSNILLIHADQWRYDCVAANGHPLLQTPHLDRLAAEGVRFTHAFTPSPICVPERNCLLHGQWATRHGCITNYDSEAPKPVEGTPITFTRVLKEAGYYLGYVGKWHVRRDKEPTDPMYGYDDYVSEDAPYAEWRAAQGYAPGPHTNGWFGEVDPHIPPEGSRIVWGVDRALEYIRRGQERGGPWMVRWDPVEPHLPNVVPEPYASMYPPETIAPWPSFPDPLVGKPYIQVQQRRTWKVDGWGWERWAPIVSRYLGEISLLDFAVGRLLAGLERLGERDNTLVVFTSDHGDLCGGHGMMDKMHIMYEDVVHVPLIVRWPGVAPAGQVQDAFISHALDLAATFCEAAGAEIPAGFQGESLVTCLRDGVGPERDGIASTFAGNQFGLYSQRMWRERRWKYIWNPTAEDELYDLETDPGEVTNRATDPACAGLLQRLRERLVAWMEATDDPLLNQWTRPQLLEGLKV